MGCSGPRLRSRREQASGWPKMLALVYSLTENDSCPGISRKQLDLCTESAEEPLFRNYLANGTPSCIVALVTIERIVRRDVRWHSDNFGKGTRNNWRSLAVVHFQSTTRTKGMGTRPQHSSHDYSPVPVRC